MRALYISFLFLAASGFAGGFAGVLSRSALAADDMIDEMVADQPTEQSLGSEFSLQDNFMDNLFPGYGDLTFFATANFGYLLKDGTLGATSDAGDKTQFQSARSLVGADWLWDIGRSHKLLGHYEYGGDFTKATDVFDDAKPFKNWFGISNFLGALTFGKQSSAFFEYYGRFLNQPQTFYAPGYTSKHAGGIELQNDVIKFSTSVGRLGFDFDYRPEGLDSQGRRYTAGISYDQWLSRISFGAAFDRLETENGEDINRFGAAAEYKAEQWSVGGGAHLISDDSSDDTKSFNLLGKFQITQDNALDLSLSTIIDDDLYDSFLGAGYFIDHKFGSQFSLYSEGAVTRAEAANGSDVFTNSQFLFGARYNFGNVWY